MKKVEVKELCKIYKFKKDGFGDLVIDKQATVKCLFIFGQARDESNFQQLATTDAHAYLDIDNDFVKSIMTSDLKRNTYYFVINRYGRNDWYKIERVKIGRTVLTDNKDNNVHVFLSFSEKMLKDDSCIEW